MSRIRRSWLQAKRVVGHSGRLVPYWYRVATRAPLRVQVMSLYRRVLPDERWIALERITLASDVRTWRRPHHGFAVDGDWDRDHTTPRASIFDPAALDTVKSTTHETIRALFIEGRPYEDTAQFREMMAAVKRGEPQFAYGCRSPAQVHHYFQVLLDTHRTMQQDGYRTQRELGQFSGDEIKLYVTRDGEFCHGNGGNHRIRIAELLGIRHVPFVFAGGHADWLAAESMSRQKPPRASLLEWCAEQELAGVFHRRRPCV